MSATLGAVTAHAASVHASAVTYLADDTDTGDELHKAGPIAIVVIIVLCVACFFLFRSMSGHLRRVRDEFPEPGAPDDRAVRSPGATTPAGATPPTPTPQPTSSRADHSPPGAA